jgi:hypothetical protein
MIFFNEFADSHVVSYVPYDCVFFYWESKMGKLSES